MLFWQGKKECHRVARNIADLLQGDFLNDDGLFLCSCGGAGFIPKTFQLQEPGEIWEPKLKGVIKLADEGDSYQCNVPQKLGSWLTGC